MLTRNMTTAENRHYWAHVDTVARRVAEDPVMGPAFREWKARYKEDADMSRNTDTYLQCRLEKGIATQVAWIPKRYAVPAKVLELKNDDNQWENGWVVSSVGNIELAEAIVAERSRDWKRTRAASDI